MEIASGLLSSACQLACGPICQQLHYIRKLRENEETMQAEWTTLMSQKSDILTNLNTGEVRDGKRPKDVVMDWLDKVEKIDKRVKSLGSGDANHMCLKGFCQNYYTRLKRSKKAVGVLREVKDLQEKGMLFAQRENLFIDSLPEASSSLPATTLHGTSAERKKEEILQCILNPEVSKIGVYGMGGVGKTTIMTQIYNELSKKQDFEIVIWVTVSSTLNEEGIQNKIAERLHCQLSSSADLTSRAQVLHEAFRRRRNFVIILDDIWKSISLRNVGILEPNRANGSKVVWTTRFLAVCNGMESEREIKVEGLTDEEAWTLFKNKVGAEDVIMSVEIQPVAKQVARECGGLPLALITVACALRKAYQLQVWRNALQQLKTSRGDQIHGVGKEVFGSLKFSYNWLSSDTIRSCLLYCALYPEDVYIKVDELIEYWMAEGLINEEGCIQIEKDKGHAYLKELKDSCMIESIGNGDKFVMMHDLIRDLAINIRGEQFMVKAGLWLKESPKEEEWVESLERVSLMNNQMEAFEVEPNCPRLSTLLLNHGGNLGTFSSAFFKHMHNLRVLDLSNTQIRSLPDSLSDLVNLHALILTRCSKLECLPSLAKLHKLRQLKLFGLFSLKELPHGLENLVKLRHLDISFGGWGSFPYGVLLKMSCLEILLMENRRWRLSYASNGDVKENSTIEEIIRLKKLASFSSCFADVLTINSFINKADESELFKNLDHFKLKLRYENYLDVGNDSNVEKEKVRLPRSANFLSIVAGEFIQLSDIFHGDDLRQLTHCGIRGSHCMKWIEEGGKIVFPSLEFLGLFDLSRFQVLFKEKAHEETLKNLKGLHIYECHKLKHLISIDLLVKNFRNLEEILIAKCNKMEVIISSDTDAATTITLPKLKTLKLWNLPVLTSIYQGKGKLVCDSLCDILIGDCPKLKKLPFLMKNELPVGMKMVASEEWWEMLEWEDPHLKELLQPFFHPGGDMIGYFPPGLDGPSRSITIGKLDVQDEDQRFRFHK